jgi:hypothetical protein
MGMAKYLDVPVLSLTVGNNNNVSPSKTKMGTTRLLKD